MGETRDALVFVDAKSGRIEDISEAAGVMLGVGTEALTGGAFFQEFEDRRRAEFLDSLNAAAATAGRRSPQPRDATGPAEDPQHPVRAAGRVILLCRLEADVAARRSARSWAQSARPLRPRLRRRRLHRFPRRHPGANEAFLKLLDVPSLAALAGKSISEFLVRGSVDLRILIDGAAAVGAGAAVLHAARDRLRVAAAGRVSVTNLSERVDPTFGFVLRDTSRAEPRAPRQRRRPATSPGTSWTSSAHRRSRTSSRRPPM